MKVYNLGVLGLGTVASGVVESIEGNAALYASRFGMEFNISKIAVRNLDSKRIVDVAKALLTTDPYEVVNSSEVDIVVELIGGEEPARSLVLQALENGKAVVTANKALIAQYGPELFAAAAANKTRIFFEASVAGGIPVIKGLCEGLSGNAIDSIHGILNGTCNFILSRMEAGESFGAALQEAQDLGYAEADPTLDIGGFDAGHKAAILASLAFGQWFTSSDVSVKGIENLELSDIEFAKDAGYRIKLIANIYRDSNSKVSIDVQPTLVPDYSMIGTVANAYNGIKISGNVVGDTFFYGQGAGKDATASAVMADIIDASKGISEDTLKDYPGFKVFDGANGLAEKGSVASRFYLNVMVQDSPSSLAAITGVLGECGVSIASIAQKERSENYVPVVIMTHEVPVRDVEKAIAKIAELSVVNEMPYSFRIEDID